MSKQNRRLGLLASSSLAALLIGGWAPAAFAVAITRRGVDAGVSEFRRFALGKTTSGNTFEPRYLGGVPVPTTSANARSNAFECLLGLIEKLPDDRKEGQRWRFVASHTI